MFLEPTVIKACDDANRSSGLSQLPTRYAHIHNSPGIEVGVVAIQTGLDDQRINE